MPDPRVEAAARQMIAEGYDDDEIRAAIANVAPAPKGVVSASEPDTYMGGAIKGFKEGAAAGAKGFAEGVLPGVGEGIKGTLMLPVNLVRGLFSAGINLVEDPEGAYNAVKNTFTEAPETVKSAIANTIQLAKDDPEGFGKAVGNITGQAEVGVASSKLTPVGIKPAARGVGSALESTGKVMGWPARISGAHAIIGGNPMGAALIAAPKYVERAGEALREWGELDAPFMLKNNPSGAREIVAPTSKRAIRMQGPTAEARPAAVPYAEATPAPYRTAAKQAVKEEQNAERLKTLQAAKEGLEPGEKTVTESLSATTPEGGRVSSSQSFAPKEPEAVGGPKQPSLLSADDRAQLKRQGYKPDQIAEIERRLAPQKPARPRAGIGVELGIPEERLVPPVGAHIDELMGPPKGDLNEVLAQAKYAGPERRVGGRLPEGISERRMSELTKRFGGTAAEAPTSAAPAASGAPNAAIRTGTVPAGEALVPASRLDALVTTLRERYGSEIERLRTDHGTDEAAQLLKKAHPELGAFKTKDLANVIDRVSGGPAGLLPAVARAQIDKAMATMDDAAKEAYFRAAPNAAARNYIKSKMGFGPNE